MQVKMCLITYSYSGYICTYYWVFVPLWIYKWTSNSKLWPGSCRLGLGKRFIDERFWFCLLWYGLILLLTNIYWDKASMLLHLDLKTNWHLLLPSSVICHIRNDGSEAKYELYILHHRYCETDLVKTCVVTKYLVHQLWQEWTTVIVKCRFIPSICFVILMHEFNHLPGSLFTPTGSERQDIVK